MLGSTWQPWYQCLDLLHTAYLSEQQSTYIHVYLLVKIKQRPLRFEPSGSGWGQQYNFQIRKVSNFLQLTLIRLQDFRLGNLKKKWIQRTLNSSRDWFEKFASDKFMQRNCFFESSFLTLTQGLNIENVFPYAFKLTFSLRFFSSKLIIIINLSHYESC